MRGSAQEAKVLYVSNAGCVGGAERSLLGLIEAIRHTACVRAVLACPAGSELLAEAEGCGIPCEALRPVEFAKCGRGIRRLTALGSLFRMVRALRHIVRRHHTELVHANGMQACVACLLAAAWARIPCVWHVRDFPKRRMLARVLLRGTRLALAPSRFIESALLSISNRTTNRVRVVPNGVAAPCNDPSAALALRRTLLPNNDAPLIAMVAQMVPWKRHLLFLDAASRVAERSPEARFALAGKDLWGVAGGYEQMISARADMPDLRGRVHVLGYRSDIGDVLSASDIVVLPSDREPFGRVVVEAWHCKCAVVVSHIGGPAGMVEDGVTGLHFHSDDAESLACAIRRLIADPVLRNGLAAAGAREAGRYGVAAHAEGVLNAYREVLEC